MAIIRACYRPAVRLVAKVLVRGRQIVMNLVKSSTVKLVGVLSLGLALSAYGFSDRQKAAIEERIKPVGTVCMEGDSSCGSAMAAAGGGAQSPEDIYNSNCMACHSTGAAGAPKLGDAGDWTERLGKGIDVVYANAINGINGMPAKGLCMSCSDSDIEAVVDYIVDNSK